MQCIDGLGPIGSAFLQRKLCKFNVPVTQLVPGEFINCLRRVVQFKIAQSLFNGFRDSLQARDDPTIRNREFHVMSMQPLGRATRRFLNGLSRCRIELKVEELGRIPDLVAKSAVPFHPVDGQLDVAPLPRHRGQGETQRICTMLVNQQQRINHVPA